MSAEKRSKTKRTTPDGAAVLATVRALVVERARTRRDDPRRAEIEREAKALKAPDAIAAVDAFLAQHAAKLQVRCGALDDAGARVTEAHGALHPLHRALLARHGGFLEVAIDPEHWPHRRHGDGLRVLGVAAEHACDLATQRDRHRQSVETLLAMSGGQDQQRTKALERARTMIPFLTTLEGVADAWVTRGRKLEWLTEGRVGRGPDRDALDHPRFGAPFALVVRLLAIEARLAHIARWKELATLLAPLGPVGADARGRMTLEGDPFTSLDFAAPPGRPEPLTVAVFEELDSVLESGRLVDPLFEKRMTEAAARQRGVSVKASLARVLFARHDLLLEGLTTEELRVAIERARHARAWFADPSLAPFDEGTATAPPPGLAAVLSAARADEAGLRGRLEETKAPSARLEVRGVGETYPRVRWAYVPARPPPVLSHLAERYSALWHTVERDGAVWLEAELLVAALSPARIEALMAAL